MSIQRLFHPGFLFFLIVLSGCASTHTYKTMGVATDSQPTAEKQITVFQRGDAITENFQILGKVTVNCNTGISQGSAIKQMKTIAAQSGADGIIDLHLGPGCQWRHDAGVHYNALMVKWLPPGTPTNALEKKFLISRLPIVDPKSPDKKLVLKNVRGYGLPLMDFPWANTLIFKGYYILPEYSEDNALSKQAQLLVKADLISNSQSLSLITLINGVANLSKDYEAELNIEMIDRESGVVIKEERSKGEAFQHWISSLIESGTELALGKAINEALKDLPDIPSDCP